MTEPGRQSPARAERRQMKETRGVVKRIAAFPIAHADCGNTCHVAVKAKDYIFHPYEIR